MNLEFEKYCKVDQSPRTVLPSSQHHAKREISSKQPKSSSRKNQLSFDGGFEEIKCRDYYRSISCRALPAQNTEFGVDREVLKRDSIYESSKEKVFNRPETAFEGRKKIEFSGSGAAPFSFSLLDSICGSDEEEQEESSIKQRSSKVDVRERSSYRLAERDFMSNSKFKSEGVFGPSNRANLLNEDDNQALQKSLLARLELPHSPMHLDSQSSRFTPTKMILDPFIHRKTHQSLAKLDNGSFRSLGPPKKTLRKSLLHDFSGIAPQTECSPHNLKKNLFSPAHLHGDLKMEHKHKVPWFELSLPHSDNVLATKTWKGEDALNWVYTFHSLPARKKNNSGGCGVKYSSKDLPLVGQMKVSCHLCSDLKGGALSESLLTKFVLYDTMHARKRLAAEEVLGPAGDAVKANAVELRSLDPSHEVAAINIEVPFEKRESMKHRSSLLDSSLAKQTPKNIIDGSSTKVNVVTPLGHHSLPTCESRGPLPLLDRWRLGGGCDCGGWDMTCPLVVFDNVRTQCRDEGFSLLHNNQPFNLFLKGVKEKASALTLRPTRKGRYSVDFHAQLSELQAFAICVAILHASEACPTADQEKHKQLLQCTSIKAVVEDNVKILIEEEDKDKERANHPPSFVLNPPFSPIARD